MTLKIGKTDIGSDASVYFAPNQTANVINFTIRTLANGSTHRASLLNQFKFADMVTPFHQAGKTIYLDNSPFKSNVVYLDITSLYTGWAIILNPMSDRKLGPGVWELGFSFFLINDTDIQDYTSSFEAEDFNVAGTDTDDTSCSNEKKVNYTPTVSAVTVVSLAPSLPAGDYTVDVHLYSATTTTALVQLKIGAVEYGWTGNTLADTWEIVPLGTPTLTGSETLIIEAKDPTNTNIISFDLIQIKKSTYTGQYRERLNTGALA